MSPPHESRLGTEIGIGVSLCVKRRVGYASKKQLVAEVHMGNTASADGGGGCVNRQSARASNSGACIAWIPVCAVELCPAGCRACFLSLRPVHCTLRAFGAFLCQLGSQGGIRRILVDWSLSVAHTCELCRAIGLLHGGARKVDALVSKKHELPRAALSQLRHRGRS